ncbi:ferritin-like protein 1 [Saccoglossus kowalevskii]|uniref:Ferritin n=1 Tax=Saccoglossus kowalevskii TaxID=10224 RepID=D1LX06_SACKO|nr:ferritin-like protein 1 [Saccoglossus kowalevskii]ACY92512.1 ferritin-like protein 1 [Saccoglossus kowalevskii]
MAQCRQNYHEECEAAVNKQINLELYSSYVYLSMALHYDRDDISLGGACKFFKKSSDEEREHAEKLMKFQNKRGGRIVLQDVKKPQKDEWGTLLQAFETALDLEKLVNQALLDLHELASKHGDSHMSDFIEETFLCEQVESMKEISDHITNLKRVGPGLGEYTYCKDLSS